jgi:RNA polymerase sigma-70 factor, ECF subfamily
MVASPSEMTRGEATRDGAAFRRLFEGEFDYVWSSLRRLGVREADLEDQTHELFLRVHRKLAEYDPARPIRPWLLAFAARIAAEYRRTAHYRREVTGLSVELADTAAHPEEAASRAEIRATVLEALEALDLDKRVVFVAVEIDGHAGRELAEALQIPLNTVYSRLRLAREEFSIALRRIQKRGGLE